MAKPLPKWVMQRYAKLWNKFTDDEMTYEEIEKTLKMDGKNTNHQ